LDGAGGDEFSAGLGQAAPQGCRGEAQEASKEDGFGAMDIAQAAAGDDQGCKGDEAGDDDALGFACRGVQIRGDRRQGDVYDEGVDDGVRI
jgi:hypothetical protein